MSRIAVACLAFTIVATAPPAFAQELHQAWWKYLQGEWSYENSESSGTVAYRYAAKKNAVVARFEDKDGTVSIELLGRDAASKTVTATGFGSDSGSWRIEFTELTADAGEGSMRTVSGNGSSVEAQFEIKQTGPNGFEWTSNRKDGGGDTVKRWGKFKRKG
ncbi:hypothetical protein NZK35_33475 [Stieleria sp. ICT_E10.1]|uniref:hypothetical protein n=1 Tax=Stieleria sedimenti TaxID=2976331 RepID=UPI00217F5ED2|nr:hypothetical protein [Stieleria sedimenti]MCS7471586.1 hypothetical protein [Stieleria sedimenti]